MVTDTENTMRRLSKKLGIKYDDILSRPTIINKKHLGNSSFKKSKKYLGKIFYKKKKFDIRRLPNEYKSILETIKKVKV